MKTSQYFYVHLSKNLRQGNTLPFYQYEGDCSTEGSLTEIKVSDELFYGNRKVTWDELLEIHAKVPKDSEAVLKVLDFYFD